jgi:hypothetical protein
MRVIALGTIAALAVAAPLTAQLRVETGGGQARLDQMPSSSLTALGGSLDAAFGRTRLQLAGNAQDHIGLGVAGMMGGGLHYRFAPAAWTVEVGPIMQVARGIGEQWAGTLAADLRAQRTFGRFTARGGWQEGVARLGSSQSTWRRPSFGADFRLGAVQLAASWQGTTVNDSVLRDNVFFAPIADQSDTLYRARVRDIQDVTARLAWSGSALSLSARVGRRFGASVVPETWWEGRAALHLTPIMSLTMQTGHLASDALLALRGGQYTTFGLQIDLLQHTRQGDHVVRFVATEIVRESPATVHLLFVLPPATRHATLASDLTEWRSIDLNRTDDGRWEVVLNAAAGVYRLNISADNGPWRAPAGLPAIEDGFGAKVGLLVLDK